MSVRKIVALIVVQIPLLVFGQDSPISQWGNNMLQANPSLAGSAKAIRTNLFYRNQWHKSEAKFQYYGVNVDMPIGDKMGVGISVNNEQAMAFSRPNLFASYSYSTLINHNSAVYYGIKLGLLQEFVRAGDLIFEQPEFVPNKSSGVRVDAGIGVSAIIKQLFATLTVEHLTKPYQGFSLTNESRMGVKWTIGVAYTYKFSTLTKKNSVEIMPNMLFQQQKTQQNLQIGVITQVNYLQFGVQCRKNMNIDMPTTSILFGYKNLDFRLVYSYDIETSYKTSKMGNTHEVSLTKLFNINKEKQRKVIECPSFLR